MELLSVGGGYLEAPTVFLQLRRLKCLVVSLAVMFNLVSGLIARSLLPLASPVYVIEARGI